MTRNPATSLLANKITLITGASAGLGKTLALKLAKQGSKVILISRNKQALQKVQEQIQAQEGFADIIVYMLKAPKDINLSHVVVNKVGNN